MERKQPRVANAIDSNHAAGTPACPWGHPPAYGLPKRKQGKGKKQGPFNSIAGNSLQSICAGIGDPK